MRPIRLKRHLATTMRSQQGWIGREYFTLLMNQIRVSRSK